MTEDPRRVAAGRRGGSIDRRHLLLGAAAVAAAACTANGSDGSGSGARAPTTGSTGPGGTLLTAGAGTTSTHTSTVPATGATAPTACTLSPEVTAGPYYLPGHLARRDITEGRPGTPLELRIQVLGLPSCTPLAGAAVDVWHCDAGGEYSGFNGNSLDATQAGGTNDKRFLRGVQLTGGDGVATFTTIFPGWYEGRTVHIHLKVIEGGSLGTTYAGGHVAHVGQAFFDEVLTAELMGRAPYAARRGQRTTNDQDSIFRQAGPGAITAMAPSGAGYAGTFTCMVDPSATPPDAPLF